MLFSREHYLDRAAAMTEVGAYSGWINMESEDD